MSTHNIGFYGEISKISSELSSNTHLICSSDPTLNFPLFLLKGTKLGLLLYGNVPVNS